MKDKRNLRSISRRRWLAIAFVIGALALALRVSSAPIPPFDDLYHWKRIASFPRLLEFDPDRGLGGAFCPWPPLYDFVCGAAARVVPLGWLAPAGFAVFCAALAWTRREVVAPLMLALAPYLVSVSRTNCLDHHWVEPMLIVAILAATKRRNGWMLFAALTASMFVQTALLGGAAIAFVALFLFEEEGPPFAAFAATAIVIALYRLTRPPAYPDSAWFLGWVHVAAFAAAVVALALRRRAGPVIALAIGALCLAPVLPMVIRGMHFFGGDPWLSAITEFQPMFRNPAQIGTDVANLTGAALLAFTIVRRDRTTALFAIVYLALALTSRRFLVPAIPLLAISGATAVAHARTRMLAMVFSMAILIPPLAWNVYDRTHESPSELASPIPVAMQIRALPPGRVLAPWWTGHAIDVVGRHPVVIDNFGSMPDEALFTEATRALETHDVQWCRRHGVRYLVEFARGKFRVGRVE